MEQNFVWCGPELRVSIRKNGVHFSNELGQILDEKGWTHVNVGYDAKNKVLAVVQADEKTGIRLSKRGTTGKAITRKTVLTWLEQMGVDHGRFPATWDESKGKEYLLVNIGSPLGSKSK